MPLPNYGYFNKEEKKHQELVFDMAPEYVDRDSNPLSSRSNAKESSNLQNKRAQVTTGKLGIDLERKMVIHEEKDPNVWKSPQIDHNELLEAKKYATPERKNLRREVRSSIESLISGRKAREIRDGDNKRQPSDIGIYMDSSNLDNTSLSPPTTPVRRNFSSMSSEHSSRASPSNYSNASSRNFSGNSSFGGSQLASSPPSNPITRFGGTSPMGNSSFAQEHSSYFASSSTSAYSSSSSNFRKPSESIQDFKGHGMLDDFSSPLRSRDIGGSESILQKRSSSMVSTERIIPVRRQ